jgi:hypothetical protein
MFLFWFVDVFFGFFFFFNCVCGLVVFRYDHIDKHLQDWTMQQIMNAKFWFSGLLHHEKVFNENYVAYTKVTSSIFLEDGFLLDINFIHLLHLSNLYTYHKTTYRISKIVTSGFQGNIKGFLQTCDVHILESHVLRFCI